jgi:lysozyme
MTKSIDIATKLIKLNEGCKLEVYTCPAGKPTFGYGTNLEVLDADINKIIEQINNCKDKEALAVDLLQREIVNCQQALNTQKWFTDDLSEFQQAIILDLAYNIGVAGVLNFKKMIEAIKQRNYGIASTEMLDSKYHYQMICFGYKDELADAGIDIANRVDVFRWYNDLDKDYKLLRSACNALSLQFDKPLGKYKELI